MAELARAETERIAIVEGVNPGAKMGPFLAVPDAVARWDLEQANRNID